MKAFYNYGKLSYFKPTGLTATISSSSTIVGAEQATLTVQVTPKYILAAAGYVEITFPEYYPDAGSHYMIDKTSPTCITSSAASILACTFDKSTRRLVIQYSFNNGLSYKGQVTF